MLSLGISVSIVTVFESSITLISNKTPTLNSLSFPNTTHYSHSLSSSLFFQGSNGLCLSASKNPIGGNASLLETGGIDDEFGEDYEDDDDDDYDDDDVFVPLRNMKTWLENKPRGFGEGRVYDTTIEDKLLDEIQQSRVAQLANINKFKNNPLKPSNKINQQKGKKAPEIIPTGIRVLLANLPKKKNIHRDLKLAFDGIPGIVNIIPAVLGNKKTRDPVCKGFAFIDFKSEEDANRFVQLFSGQTIKFGKIEKQIKCEKMNSLFQTSVEVHTADMTNAVSELTIGNMEEDLDAEFDGNSPSVYSLEEEETFYDDPEDIDDQPESSSEWEEARDGLLSLDISRLESSDRRAMEQSTETADSFLLKQQKKLQATMKRRLVKKKTKKVPKLSSLGSANRLKVKEKSMLTDVFARYAAKSASVSEEENA